MKSGDRFFNYFNIMAEIVADATILLYNHRFECVTLVRGSGMVSKYGPATGLAIGHVKITRECLLLAVLRYLCHKLLRLSTVRKRPEANIPVVWNMGGQVNKKDISTDSAYKGNSTNNNNADPAETRAFAGDLD